MKAGKPYIQTLTLLLCSCIFCTTSFANKDLNAAIAMITDLTGSVSNGNRRILDTLKVGTKISVKKNASITLIYLNSGKEYVVHGPDVLRIGKESPQLQSKTAVSGRNLLGNNENIRLKPTRLIHAMSTMRSSKKSKFRLLELNNATSLQTHPVFRWEQVEPGARYHFELFDENGEMIIDTTIKRSAFKLPSNIHLKPEQDYVWKVSTRVNGRRYVKEAEFSILNEKTRALVEKLRPQSNASFSQRLVFASLLAQLGLDDEATKYWEKLEQERSSQRSFRQVSGGH